MKSEKLIQQIGQIDDSIIKEAETAIINCGAIKRTWLKWTSIAAACIVVAVVVTLLPKQTYNYSGLAKLPVNTDLGAFGFEGYLAYDVSELQNGNPWREDNDLKTLPVFTNPVECEPSGRPIKGLSAGEMIEKAKETASVMGFTPDSVFTVPTEEELREEQEKGGQQSDGTPYKASAVCEDATIEVEATGEVSIIFEKGVPLPGQYSFTYFNTTRQQAIDVMKYLLQQYKPVVAMKSPSLDIFGHYNIHGQYSFNFNAFENTGTLTDKILGYNFNLVGFSPNEAGDLWIIRRYLADLSKKIGDYPIITSKEARKLLLKNHYITTVPEKLPDEKYIAHVELVYRSSRLDEVFMPYYKFLVEMPTMQMENGLKTYGAFYVPAIKGEFLESMPLWRGGFN